MSNRAMIRGVINSPKHDPHWDKVVSLLHFDGTNGSTVFSDVKGLSWSGSGDAKLTTSEKKFGSSSLRCEYSKSSYISATNSGFAVGTGDFTAECWFYTEAASLPQCIVGGHYDATAFQLVIYSYSIYLQTNNADIIYGGSISSNTWYHVAVVKKAGTWALYLNGVSIGTYSSENNITRTNFLVGNNDSNNYMVGYIDEFRFTKEIARYTSNFSPPTKEFSHFG